MAIPVPHGCVGINSLILHDNQAMMAIHWAGKEEKWLQNCNYLYIIINDLKFLYIFAFLQPD